MPDHAPPDHHAGHGAVNPEVRHERTDANVNSIIGFGIGFVVFAVVAHVALWYFFLGLDRREASKDRPPPAIARERPRFPQDIEKIPAPRLQTADKIEMDQLAKRDNDRLTSYGWADPKAGAVHVPLAPLLDQLADPKVAAAKGIKTREWKKADR